MKFPRATLPESLLFTLSEFLERLVALIPAPKFDTTRYYGVFASRSPHRRYLPDKPTSTIDVEQSADGQDSDPPVAGSSGKKQKQRKRKRISWAQLLKRTFKIDFLKCDNSASPFVAPWKGQTTNSEIINFASTPMSEAASFTF